MSTGSAACFRQAGERAEHARVRNGAFPPAGRNQREGRCRKAWEMRHGRRHGECGGLPGKTQKAAAPAQACVVVAVEYASFPYHGLPQESVKKVYFLERHSGEGTRFLRSRPLPEHASPAGERAAEKKPDAASSAGKALPPPPAEPRPMPELSHLPKGSSPFSLRRFAVPMQQPAGIRVLGPPVPFLQRKARMIFFCLFRHRKRKRRRPRKVFQGILRPCQTKKKRNNAVTPCFLSLNYCRSNIAIPHRSG